MCWRSCALILRFGVLGRAVLFVSCLVLFRSVGPSLGRARGDCGDVLQPQWPEGCFLFVGVAWQWLVVCS